MRFTADIVFKPHVIAQGIDEAGLPVTGIILRIMDRDDCVRLIRRIRSTLRRAQCGGSPNTFIAGLGSVDRPRPRG